MRSKRYFSWTPRRAAATVLFATSIVVCGTGAALSTYAQAPGAFVSREGVMKFVVEVKEHASTNRQINVDPARKAPDFGRGDYYILDGTVYPDFSIPRGPKAEPHPNAPKLGTYSQRGVFTVEMDQFLKALEGAEDVSPTVAFATELITFNDGSTILMDGLWPNAYFSANRVVLGGTGRFQNVVGSVIEENIGEDNDGFCNLRMTFTLRQVNGNDR